jgi:outer membrane protein OmpA-like peptidoglycan-associated protein
MRRFIVLSLLMIPTVAVAQNYVPADHYNNPSVMVNLDVLGQGVTPPSAFPLPYPQVPQEAREPVLLTAPQPLPVSPPQMAPESMAGMMDAQELPPPQEVSTLTPDAMPASIPVPISARPQNAPTKDSSRELLAQARAAAEAEMSPTPVKQAKPSQKRELVLFDEPGVASKVQSKDMAKDMDTSYGAMPPPIPAPKESVLERNVVTKIKEDLPAPSSAKQMDKPAEQKDGFEAYRLFFTGQEDKLKPDEQAVLNGLIAKLKKDPSLRVQILGFADGTPETTSKARRLSLARALMVRSTMLAGGIEQGRVDLRAMGANHLSGGSTDSSKAPPDRVDVLFLRD